MRVRERRLHAACDALGFDFHEPGTRPHTAWGMDETGAVHLVSVDPRANTARHACDDPVCRGRDRSVELVLDSTD